MDLVVGYLGSCGRRCAVPRDARDVERVDGDNKPAQHVGDGARACGGSLRHLLRGPAFRAVTRSAMARLLRSPLTMVVPSGAG